jgi:hypothetical protein
MIFMSDKTDEPLIKELIETIQKKDPIATIKKTLVTFVKSWHINREPPNLLKATKKRVK